MYKNVLQNIDNIGIWPVISFVIFFLFFICLLWWVFTADKKFINKMKNLPMDDSPEKKKTKSKIKILKKPLLLFIILLTTVSAYAQDTAPAESKAFMDDPFNSPLMALYLIMTFVFIVIVLLITVALYTTKIVNLLTSQSEKEKVAKLGIMYAPAPGWWAKFSQRMNASVPVEQEQNIEMDHNYDGIKELDNHLPPWWKWLFYGTIGWAVVYIIVFHISNTLPLSKEEYQNEIALAEEQSRKFKAAQPRAIIDESALQFTNNASLIEKGKLVFMNNNCGSCHRNDGGGNTIGPNLADEFWLHGGDIKYIFSTIKNGVVEKGMPAWGKAMSPENVRDVTFYVMSLQGTKPPSAKAPQGELFKPSSEKTDSTKIQVQASL